MKAILLASAVLAASSATAFAGEGGHDAFAQNLSEPLQTYVIDPAEAPARESAMRRQPLGSELPFAMVASGNAGRNG